MIQFLAWSHPGKRFIWLGHLKAHISTHTGEKTHVCSDCYIKRIQLAHDDPHRRNLMCVQIVVKDSVG